MPELPEVERVRQSVEARVLGHTVARVQLGRRDVLVMPGDPAGGWSRSGSEARPRRYTQADLLAGSRIVSVRRHGKQLALVGDAGRVVLVHLGMTGQLRALAPGARGPTDHVHVVWTLQDERGATGRLIFRDPRRFGGVWSLASPEALSERWAALGPDALGITANDLRRALNPASDQRALTARPKTTSIKAALLDQATLAGVGNIYADEACFRAGISPARPVDRLGASEIEGLAEAIRSVLQQALAAGGSTLRDYVDAEGNAGGAQRLHAVYGRSGQACVTCSEALSSARIAQRMTVWCPRCQR